MNDSTWRMSQIIQSVNFELLQLCQFMMVNECLHSPNDFEVTRWWSKRSALIFCCNHIKSIDYMFELLHCSIWCSQVQSHNAHFLFVLPHDELIIFYFDRFVISKQDTYRDIEVKVHHISTPVQERNSVWQEVMEICLINNHLQLCMCTANTVR